MNKELKVYEDIRLLNIEDDSVSDWPLDQATHVRVTLPWSVDHQLNMKAGGVFPCRSHDMRVYPAGQEFC